jgi:hypothetical protein
VKSARLPCAAKRGNTMANETATLAAYVADLKFTDILPRY